jgi:cyclopropane fatty-acyl-phospholipid synthase-like methyltransferase
MERSNPFTSVDEPAILGPGTLDMALPLVDALRVRPGMRVLEVGGGTGQVATILAKAWDVTVFTLEPWHGGEDIQARAAAAGVTDRVIALTSRAQELPFAADTFDAVLSINSF